MTDKLDQFFLGAAAVVIAAGLMFIGGVIASSSIRSECLAFGRLHLFGTMYVCTKETPTNG